jgi:hypothetical protein
MKRSGIFFAVIWTVGSILPIAAAADHSFSLVYNVTHLTTTEGDVYNFYSPGLNYTYNARCRFGLFSSLSALFPLISNQNGTNYINWDYYMLMFGFDLMLGAGGKLPLSERFTFVPALGAHLNGIWLKGKALFRDFYNLTTGLGTNLQIRYAMSRCLEGIGFVSGSWDFVDLIHQGNRLKNGLILTVGVGISF